MITRWYLVSRMLLDINSVSILMSWAGETLILTKLDLYHVFVLQIFMVYDPPRYITYRKNKRLRLWIWLKTNCIITWKFVCLLFRKKFLHQWEFYIMYFVHIYPHSQFHSDLSTHPPNQPTNKHCFFSLFKTFRVQGVSSKLISIKLPEVSAHETTSLLPIPNSLPSHNFFPLNVSNSAQQGLSLSGDISPNNSYLGCLECTNAYSWRGQVGGSRGVWCRESNAQRSNYGSTLMDSQVFFLPASSFLLCLLN